MKNKTLKVIPRPKSQNPGSGLCDLHIRTASRAVGYNEQQRVNEQMPVLKIGLKVVFVENFDPLAAYIKTCGISWIPTCHLDCGALMREHCSRSIDWARCTDRRVPASPRSDTRRDDADGEHGAMAALSCLLRVNVAGRR
jgi:hypothetical protein